MRRTNHGMKTDLQVPACRSLAEFTEKYALGSILGKGTCGKVFLSGDFAVKVFILIFSIYRSVCVCGRACVCVQCACTTFSTFAQEVLPHMDFFIFHFCPGGPAPHDFFDYVCISVGTKTTFACSCLHATPIFLAGETTSTSR